MAWIVRLVSIGAGGAEHSTDVLRLARSDDLTDLASLGLTLAYELAQALGGALRAENRGGRPAFTVSLPALPEGEAGT